MLPSRSVSWPSVFYEVLVEFSNMMMPELVYPR